MKKKVKVRTTRGGHVDGEDWTENLEDVFQAAAKGNVQSLRSYLSRGVSPAVKEQELFGYNLLHLAVLSGNRAAVQLVLQYKPAINATANDGTTTALTLACGDGFDSEGGGNPDIIRLLLNAGAHVSTLSSPGTYPLLAAATASTTDTPIRLLLAAGASISAVDAEERQTALHKAAYGRREQRASSTPLTPRVNARCTWPWISPTTMTATRRMRRGAPSLRGCCWPRALIRMCWRGMAPRRFIWRW
jgi:ankyrin repeat protein